MKKALFLILALALIISMTACGGNSDKPDNSGTPSGNTDTTQSQGGDSTDNIPDLAGIIGGTGKLSDYDEATRQELIAAAQADGGNLEFKSDGSVVYTAPDGSVSIQNPDGSWTLPNGNNVQGQYGGDWPENEFTKLLPKPDFALTAAVAEADRFSVSFTNTTIEQIRAYVEQVKSKGFTVDSSTQDENVMGIEIYVFTAKNAAGYEVSISSMSGVTGLVISKP